MKDMTNIFLSRVTVEVTNICQLKCPGCPQGSDFFKNKKQGHMAFLDFKKVIDNNKKYLKNVVFIGIGEPFLNPNILKMMKYCSNNNIDIGVHTNGMCLTEEMIQAFIEIKTVLRITFSIDGISNDTYLFYRVGGNFKLVFENMLRLIRFKKRYNLKNVEIVWQFLLMKGNKHEIKMARKIAKKIQVDGFVEKNIIMTGLVSDERLSPVDIVKKEVKNKNQDNDKNLLKKEKIKCHHIKNASVFVLWDGAVVPCCSDYKREYEVGNAFRESLSEILEKKEYKKFRDCYKKNKLKICLKCRLK